MNRFRYARHGLVFVAFCLVVFVAVRIFNALPDRDIQPEDSPPVASDNDLELRDVAFTDTENGEPIWSLKADRAVYSESGQVANFKQVEVIFFAADRKERARLTARQGSANLTTRQVVVKGEVELKTPEGGHMKTDEMRYRHRDKVLVSEGLVNFEQQGVTIEGVGMTYDLDHKKLKLDSNVSAYVPFKSQN